MATNQGKSIGKLLVLACIIIAVVTVSSCRTIRFVPVDQVRTEYRHIRDTVREIDSIFHEKETVIREADSALLAKLGLKLQENERAILVLRRELEKRLREATYNSTDTFIVRDTIPVPYPVEKELTWWQGTCIHWFPWTLVAALLLIIIIIKPWRWLKKN